MSEDLGILTGLQMTIYPTDEHKKIFHKGWIGTLTDQDNNKYHCKLTSRYTKGNSMKLKFSMVNDTNAQKVEE